MRAYILTCPLIAELNVPWSCGTNHLAAAWLGDMAAFCCGAAGKLHVLEFCAGTANTAINAYI
jgi:hypothetical protein